MNVERALKIPIDERRNIFRRISRAPMLESERLDALDILFGVVDLAKDLTTPRELLN
jgi:hypothetical protein